MKRVTIYELPIDIEKDVENIYNDSSVVIYEKDRAYYLADNQNVIPWECGSAENVVEYFAQFLENE